MITTFGASLSGIFCFNFVSGSFDVYFQTWTKPRCWLQLCQVRLSIDL